MENNRWGKRIRAFRKLKRVQQAEFAKKIGMSISILGKIERGVRKPSDKQLQTIAQALEINVDELKGEG